MEWWITVSLLISNILDDAIATLCTLAIMRRKKRLAFLLTVVLSYLVSWSVKQYTANYIYINVVAWSSGVGCILGVYVDSWYRRRERLKNLKKAREAKKMKKPG